MDEVLFGVLSDGVGRYLAAVDRLAATVAAPAGPELRRLVAAWRSVLDAHRPSPRDGRCRGCGTWRSRTAMCGVWRVASGYFLRVGDDRLST